MSKKDKTPIADLVRAWKIAHGNRFHSSVRIEAMVDLIDILEKEGYSREDITTTVKRNIIDTCTNKYVAKAKAWRERVEEDLEDAIVKHYDEDKINEFEGRRVSSSGPAIQSEPLDLSELRKNREEIEPMPLEEDALLAELGIKRDGRRE